MIANVEIAKYIIENLLAKKVIKLQPIQQEKVIHGIKELKIIRYDYSCTIQLDDGSQKSIIVELQKSENHLDIGRFRNYLAKHYKEESVLTNGNTDYLPIIAIYFLGFNLENTDPFIKAECNLINLNTNKIIEQDKDEFIQKLSHDIYLIQIKRINKEGQDRLSKLFSMFNQNYKVEHNEKYKDAVLDIPEEQIQSENKNIFMHLHNMLESSDVMEDFEESLRVEKILNKNEAQRFIEGMEKGKAEGEYQAKLNIAQNLKKIGIPLENIMQATGLSQEQIDAIK
jgi:predicted transposase/invertase (TIGR01784 family)